jgi:glycosyltransferase involved in cell wall biosynthesis
VAIGMPVYNAEKYLTHSLDSILAQTYSDFDVIISDNASTDCTREICESYAARDARIHYYRNEKNLGAAPNFNRVFELSAHEYFKWAPYDDLIEREFLARCIAVLDQHPQVVLCYTRAKIIDEYGMYVTNHDPGPPTHSPDPVVRFRNLILHPEYAIQQMGVIRSAVLKQTDLHASFPSSDEVLLAALALRGPFYEIPERLYLYRRHAEQSTRTPKQRARMMFFDTGLVNKITLPKWSYFFACLKAIQRSSLTFDGRLRCYATMVRWLLVPAHWRAMGKDILRAAIQIAARVRQPPIQAPTNQV